MKPSIRFAPHRSTVRQAKHNLGAGLIEVLVAVLILALGLLGMAGLQANALKKNQSSYAREQAVRLSYYMLDAMRADRNGAIAANYNTPTTGLCSPDALTTTSLADNSRRDWLSSLRNSLGDADSSCGVINCDINANCTVTIRWNDELAGGRNNQSFTTVSRL